MGKVEHRRVNFPDGTGFDEFRVPVLGRWSPTVRIWADGLRLSTGLIKTTEQAEALVACLQASIDWARGEKEPSLQAVPLAMEGEDRR